MEYDITKTLPGAIIKFNIDNRKKMKKIILILDIQPHDNDKSWLVEELGQCKNYKLRVIYSRCVQAAAFHGSHKLKAFVDITRQAITAISMARKGDVILCWSQLSGFITFAITRLLMCRRHLVSMGWLSPRLTMSDFLKRMMIRDKKCLLVVNSPEQSEAWQQELGVYRKGAFIYMPDIYDTRIAFRYSSIKPAERYLFTGGITNRDWKRISEIAASCPDIRFECVAEKKDFEAKVKCIPSNMRVRFDIPSEEYYSCLCNAYAVLLPLETKAVGGLINIIRSAQEGILCMVTDIPVTQKYYPDNLKQKLVVDDDRWIDRIRYIMNMSNKEYSDMCRDFQDHVRLTFSPQSATKTLVNNINSFCIR